MPRSQSPTLTDAELRIMRIMWKHAPCTVAEVVEHLPERHRLAHSSVQTTMRILEQKGYLDHEKQGRAFVYRVVVGPAEARRTALRFVLDRFFDNSPELLLLNVMEDSDLDQRDLEEIGRLLKASENEAGGAGPEAENGA